MFNLKPNKEISLSPLPLPDLVYLHHEDHQACSLDDEAFQEEANLEVGMMGEGAYFEEGHQVGVGLKRKVKIDG